jgi:hypothetical protein
MSTNIVPFEAWHLEQLQLQPHELEMLDDKKFLANALAPGNDCRSTFHEGKLLGVGGYLKLWEGCFEVYMIPSVYIFEYPYVAFKVVRKCVVLLKSMLGAHRLQTGVWDNPRRIKFMEKLGFVVESRMRQYTKTREDYLQLVWIKEK